MTRWITRDPISFAGGWNLYGYVGLNPVVFADRFGLQAAAAVESVISCPPCMGALAAAGTAVGALAGLIGKGLGLALAIPTPILVVGAVVGITALVGYAVWQSRKKDKDKDDDGVRTKDLRRTGDDTVKELKKSQWLHPHDLKDKHGSKQDVFNDKDGNLYIGNKDGSGQAEPCGINLNDLRP